MSKKIHQTLAIMAGILTCMGGLFAHTPYMLPNSFSTSSAEKLTVISSFTEEFFVPDFKVDSEDFHMLLPDGSRVEFANVAFFEQVTVLESPLEKEGTYLLSTGKRLGRKFKMKRVGDGWDYIRRTSENETEEVLEGVETADFQSQTVAEAYVTKGAPSTEVLNPTGIGLEIVPLTHPSEVYFEEEFNLKIQFNGKVLAGHHLNLFREGGSYEEPKYTQEVISDEEGKITVVLDKPGVYLIMTRYQDIAPEEAETPYRSYTIALTFEAVR